MVVKVVAGLLAATALGTVTACGDTERAGGEPPSYTYEEAARMVDDMIRKSVRDMRPHPQLQVAGGGNAPCDGPNDDKPTDQVMYERRYWLRKVPSSMNTSITDQLERYWTANAYVMIINDKNDKNDVVGSSWTVVASNRSTGFTMKLVKAINGDLSLSAQSTCVNEAASPAPS